MFAHLMNIQPKKKQNFSVIVPLVYSKEEVEDIEDEVNEEFRVLVKQRFTQLQS